MPRTRSICGWQPLSKVPARPDGGWQPLERSASGWRRAGFTLMEAVTALAILSIITTGVLVTLNRSMAAMVDNRVRVQAFELARENMERLLGSDSVTDTTEFGVHELNEDIQWQNVVESFNEPVNSAMWIRAVCSASYTDRNGQRQTVELTHWITDVTKAQEKQILDQKRREQEFLEEMDGNPFGDDPDGLMRYANTLAEMGEYARAAETASELILTYPDEPQAAAAWPKLLGYSELALAAGDTVAAQGALDIIVRDHGDKPEAEKVRNKIQPIIDSGQPYAPIAIGDRRSGGSPSSSPSSGSGGTGAQTMSGVGSVAPADFPSPAGTPSGPRGGEQAGGQKPAGSTGEGNTGRNTGSGAGQSDPWDYPNPNWSPEQKRIWDAFRELDRRQ